MKITARWITAPAGAGDHVVTFRRDFVPAKAVRSATVCASAMGIYAFYLNGARVGKGVLTPGWTSYNHRIQYQTYDVTSLLRKKNRLEFGLGQGWAVGYIGYGHTNHFFADHTSLIAWAEIVYEDGSRETIRTDESWEVYTSHVLTSEIYHGETVDMTAPIRKLGHAVLSDVKTELIPQEGEWIVENERLAPVEVIRTPKGELVLDFGQNMTGYVEIRIKGERGGRIVLHHAEVLDRDGNFYTENLRSARNENIYVLSGKEDLFKPTYSFQGFRYVQLVEFPFDDVDPDNFRAVVVHSELTRTGSFRCGNEKINQLYHNIIWGQKSNFLDLPTDCPQRDERLGWTGDAEIFCRTAAINFDVEKFFAKWLADVAIEQTPEGAVKGVVPHCLINTDTRTSAAWGDVACITPWEMYLAYGDKKLLRRNFPMMKKWVGYLRSAGSEEYLWLGGLHYGDWLALDAGGEATVGATANDLIASAYYALSTRLVVLAGEALGEDVSEYRDLYRNVTAKFREYFLDGNGIPKDELPLTEQCGSHHSVDVIRRGKTQTALTLILHFGLCREEERPVLAKMLAGMIHDNGDLMTTGFVGTPYLLHALSENGYTDLAYKLLMQEKYPSWLYSVCHGATTMWEHWNSQKEDGSFWSTSMNSFNHYAYGAVFDWIFGVAAGIKPMGENPAYREITLEPHPDRCLGFADTGIETRNGKIRSYWYYKGDRVYYEFEIPEGVTAHLRLPSGYTETLGTGTYHFGE